MSPPRSGTHFIVLPGGGYAAHAENEASPIVDWLGTLGIPAAVLRYPLHARHPIPLHALRSEVRRLRAMGVSRVGVIGFSAGGHLAGHAALSDTDTPDTRVDLAVLGYAFTSMEMETYRPARLILLGEEASPGNSPGHVTGRDGHREQLRRSSSGIPPKIRTCRSSTATVLLRRSQRTTCRMRCTCFRKDRTAWGWLATPARRRPGLIWRLRGSPHG